MDQAARLNRDGAYITLTNPHTVQVHPQSSLFVGETENDSQGSREDQKGKDAVVRPGLVVYSELVFTTKEYMRNVIEVQPEWLASLAPHYYKEEEVLSEKKTGTRRKLK